MKTLLIDNYDSYTFNLFQLIALVNQEEPLVVRNDSVDWNFLKEIEFDNIVISPGPGRPENHTDFGICSKVLLESDLPVLGVCLGHQGLGRVYGAQVVHAPETMHGRISRVYHDHSQLYKDIPQGFEVVRYHSLMVNKELPNDLIETSWTADGIVMGIRHKLKPLWGVQFHPESICTEYGQQLLSNFRDITLNYQNKSRKKAFSFNELNKYSVLPRIKNNNLTKKNNDYLVNIRKLNIFVDEENVFVNLMQNESYSFWLDSNFTEKNLARFSFIGSNSGPLSKVVKYNVNTRTLEISENNTIEILKKSIFEYLEIELKRMKCYTDVPFGLNTGFVGYFGYELKAECGGDNYHKSSLPDAVFIFADRLIVFDHIEKAMYLVCLTFQDDIKDSELWFDEIESQLANMRPLLPLVNHENPEILPFSLHIHTPYQDYINDILKIKDLLRDGESYEINLTNEISTKLKDVNPLTLYRYLRVINPAPYSAYLKLGEISILSSSPERFLKIDKERTIEAKPIKGTIKRGESEIEDVKNKYQLKNDEKSKAENLMIVDLLRNDLGIVCDIGSVHVPELMDVESYKTVHQLVSTVRGKIREDVSSIKCIQAAFPGGSMTGAPKVRSMQIIDKLENRPRGVYSGAIGYLAINGAIDLNIVIRTIVIKGDELRIGVGGAIVSQSDPDDEYDESILKAKALIHAIVTSKIGFYDSNILEKLLMEELLKV